MATLIEHRCNIGRPMLSQLALLAVHFSPLGITAQSHKRVGSLSMQVICEPLNFPEVSKVAARLRNEYVVLVTGTLRNRKDPNAKIPTGEVRCKAKG